MAKVFDLHILRGRWCVPISASGNTEINETCFGVHVTPFMQLRGRSCLGTYNATTAWTEGSRIATERAT